MNNTTVKLRSIKSITAAIKKVLKQGGKYSAKLDTMIEITAGNFYAYLLIITEIEKLDNTTIEEITREGNNKKSVHPNFRALREQTEQVRKCLRELQLTLLTDATDDDDEINGIVEKINKIKNGNK